MESQPGGIKTQLRELYYTVSRPFFFAIILLTSLCVNKKGSTPVIVPYYTDPIQQHYVFGLGRDKESLDAFQSLFDD